VQTTKYNFPHISENRREESRVITIPRTTWISRQQIHWRSQSITVTTISSSTDGL